MTDKPPMLAADHIRDLVQGFTTYETVRQPKQGKDGRWRPELRVHTVTHKALLDQLEDAITGASARADEDAGRSTFTSKPAARLEALDVLERIDRESHDYAVDLGIEEPERTITKPKRKALRPRLLAISGKVGDGTDPKVKRWWVSARLATQWDTRPFQPASVPCMECWHVKSLRIDLGNELARCTECHRVWEGEAEIAVLARHVKMCTDHEITKPRHWTFDETGELVECTECLVTRDMYAEAKVAHARAERLADSQAS